MNERLQNLAREAGHFEFNKWDYFDINKFAELIVAECAKVIFETQVEYTETDAMHRIRDRVKQHFGVEE